MSSKSNKSNGVVDVGWDRWMVLSGQVSPYEIIAAEAGVPRIVLSEGVDHDVDSQWKAFLEGRGTSADEFSELLDFAMVAEDVEMIDGLLAIEDEFKEAIGVAGGGFGGAAKMKAAKKPALPGTDHKLPAAAAPKVPGAAPAAPAAVTPPAAPAAAPNGAAAPGAAATPPAAAAGPTVKQKPTLIGGIKKTVKGALGIGKALANGAARAMTTDVDHDNSFDSLLGECGMTVDEYMYACEAAVEGGDDELLDDLHQLDEIFSKLRFGGKKTKLAGTDAWAKAKDIQKKYGKDATKAATVKGRQVGQASTRQGGGTSVNEMIRQLVGEGRTKAQQYHGMLKQNAEPWQKDRFNARYKDDAKLKALRAGNKKYSTTSSNVQDHRQFAKKDGNDSLAAKAALGPRERRSAMRAKSRHIKSDD